MKVLHVFRYFWDIMNVSICSFWGIICLGSEWNVILPSYILKKLFYLGILLEVRHPCLYWGQTHSQRVEVGSRDYVLQVVVALNVQVSLLLVLSMLENLGLRLVRSLLYFEVQDRMLENLWKSRDYNSNYISLGRSLNMLKIVNKGLMRCNF